MTASLALAVIVRLMFRAASRQGEGADATVAGRFARLNAVPSLVTFDRFRRSLA
jgi:hypothetical protein